MRAIACAALALALIACGGHDGGHAFVSCANEKDVDAYAPGMEKAGSGGVIKVRLAESDPTPPIRGDNVFLVDLLDAGQQPIDGATINLDLFMPLHGHGPSKKATVTSQGRGQYRLAPVNLFMAGTWQVDVIATLADGRRDQARFRLCVE